MKYEIKNTNITTYYILYIHKIELSMVLKFNVIQFIIMKFIVNIFLNIITIEIYYKR